MVREQLQYSCLGIIHIHKCLPVGYYNVCVCVRVCVFVRVHVHALRPRCTCV